MKNRQELIDMVRDIAPDLHFEVAVWIVEAFQNNLFLPEDTCSTCKRRNEGDGYHGMFCNLENNPCEYEARCVNWLEDK